MTDLTSTIFSVGMFSGASAFFVGTMTATSSFLFLFLFLFLSSFLGLVAYHVLVYYICKLAEKLNLIEK